ncbi:50S ribosomal protein L3 [Buchnera aphidicola]|uniref:Large ribosomal subunit protein uL3 n=1 Tax=Buchnera aphidicola (Stegophylla sp.) TaxID=2315800 RepID=A0A4D6Y930_9GAMM|nr:50S ribosomal protein L3 [Buchnera aphidicola (Stegophylla sp.)]QCI26486.1 50S ribosomal protein L3 [Buchnera aphidicola (Stegophylla sp.)]
MMGLVGKKIGMTRIFTKEGTSIPITVIEVVENRVTQIKNFVNDRYCAVQITTGIKKQNKLLKPEIGHFAKYGVLPGRGLWEFKVLDTKMFHVGQKMSVNFFNVFKTVDITGISKGKGFAGTIKRWNFSMQDATHGNSLSHRAPGSIGQNQTPGRVFKGKKMAGHLGNHRVTIQNLRIVQVNTKNNLLFVKGSIPGAPGGDVIIKPSVKK